VSSASAGCKAAASEINLHKTKANKTHKHRALLWCCHFIANKKSVKATENGRNMRRKQREKKNNSRKVKFRQ
jgi:hypothetical protein